MTATAAEAKLYRARYPEKVREAKREYYHRVEKHSPAFKERAAARGKAYRAAHPEKGRERTARYAAKNRQLLNLKERERARKLAAQKKAGVAPRQVRSIEEIREYKRTWARQNWAKNVEKSRETARLQQARRRARLLDSRSPGVKRHEWAAVCRRFVRDGVVRCAYCEKREGTTVDHVVPLARGGRDEPSNVVPACLTCNSSKGKKLVSEWRKTDGRIAA